MKNTKRFLSAVSAFAILITSFPAAPMAGATEDENTVTVSPTYDMQLRYNNTSQSATGATMEVRTNWDEESVLQNDFLGAMRFEIPDTPEGKVISDVSLKLVTERVKDSSTFYLYSFEPESWSEEKINYEDVADAITAARASEPIVGFTAAGDYNKAITDGSVTAEYANVAAWTNNIDIPVGAVTEGDDFDFIISRDQATNNGSQTCFYTKDNTGANCRVQFEESGEPTVDGDNTYYPIDSELLKPVLTITYADEVTETMMDLSDAVIYSYRLADKADHVIDTDESNTVSAVNAERSISDTGSALVDGNDETIFTAGQTTNFITVIDLGVTAPVSKLVMKNVHQAAVIGVAGENEDDPNGYITDTAVTLKQNWSRMNDSATENLTETVTASYGTRTDDIYDTVTLSGDFGGVRYVVFDGNGSSSQCAEIEVYYTGELPTQAPATASPSPTATAAAAATPTVSPTPAVPDVTATVPAEPEETATPAPTAEPIPEGAIAVNGRPSNVTTTQEITVDEYGNKRTVAYTTNNTSIWYLGNYDLSQIESIQMRLGLVGRYSDGVLTNTPQVKLAYMPLDGSDINSDYIAANSGTIRSNANMVAAVGGLTEPSAAQVNGHQYLGALYTVDSTGVTVDNTSYGEYPGGTASVDMNLTSAFTPKGEGEVALFVYGTAQSCRATIDYIIIEEKDPSETQAPATDTPTEPVSTPTAEPGETDAPMVFNKFDMERASLYRYNIADKSQHTAAAGGEVTIVDANRIAQTDTALIDGDDTTIFTSGQTSNCATVIDLGVSVPVSRIVAKGVAGSAIVGVAGESADDVNGTVTETGITLRQNWARLNNSNVNNLTDDITAEYGTNDGVYDAVTLTGAFGDVRYIVFDGNGSNSACAEIEVYYDGEPLPEPTPGPTPSPTPEPTPGPGTIPDGAIIVNDQPKSSNAGTQSVTIDPEGDTRTIAYTNQSNAVWYLGTYELANIDSIDLRLGLVGQYTDDVVTSMPQVRLSYVPSDGSVVDTAYIAANDSLIRSTSQIIGAVEGLTVPEGDQYNQGHRYLGALYTIDETGVSVDNDAYAEFPGGTASVGPNSRPLDADAADGKVELFIYADAGSRRATIDYVVINEKVLTPAELRIDGADTWVIRENVDSDYETSLDAYKATLISDIGTEMKLNEGDIVWSVSGSDYVSMKTPTGINSSMVASKDLPIGNTQITLRAEYEDENGVTLSAEKNITIEKREASVPTSMTMTGESYIAKLESELPYNETYTAVILDQFGVEMSDVVVDWTVEGSNTSGYSISEGVLTIAEGAQSALLTVKATVRANTAVTAQLPVEVNISKYPSEIYPTADVLFRKDNENAANVTGPDIEIRNLADSDRGFSGGLKFDVSSIRAAIEAGYPLNSISIRFTTRVSNDGSLVLKPLSNDWDESSSVTNSFNNKEDIINDAINSDEIVVSTDEGDGVFTLARMTRGRSIYDGVRGDNESVSSWQTTLDITEYVLGWLEEHPDENEMSLLLMANYNGTTANTVFSKDVDETYTNWAALTAKFPELLETPQELYPALVADYAEETITFEQWTDSVPIPLTSTPNEVTLAASHHDPFTDTTDTDIIWSIAGFMTEDGEEAVPAGITLGQDGVLSVSMNAQPGTLTVRATAQSSDVVYNERQVRITSLDVQLANGSFENVDDAMMPVGWSSYDPAIDIDHNGVQGYEMDQASETMLASFQRANDNDGYLSGTHSAEDPTGVYGNKTVRLTGAHGITGDYEGRVYTNNAANSGTDGGPDLRVTTGVTYWISQDYHLESFYQLSDSSAVGPYVGYEGFQGTTGRSTQFSGTWYIKDGSATDAYTTDGYDTLRRQITVPQNIDRLRINWGLQGAEGSIYYRNFRLAPQGIDTSKTPVDGENELKVTGAMQWTSDGIAVVPGSSYTYKFSAQNEAMASAQVTMLFMDSEGNVLDEETVQFASPNVWTERTAEVTAPEGAAYAMLRLANGTGNGNVWYDNIIFTRTSDPIATYARITGGNDLVVSPLEGESDNTYKYEAALADQYNNAYDGSVAWSVEGSPAGISISSDGTLRVSSSAAAGTITIRAAAAENADVYAEKLVTVVKKPSSAESVGLENGDFADYDSDTLLPSGWTNSGRELSTANGSFDSSISGWKLNYTTYTQSDTSAAMEWDGTVDHTGNSGGSARIYNADRAQGSMQISQNIDIVGGGTYDISVWVKTHNFTSDSNVYATLIFYDENGSTIEENKQLLVFYPEGGSTGVNTSDWTKLSGTIYVNDLASRLRIDMRYRGGANNRQGTVWFDDLEISKQASIDTDIAYEGGPSVSLRGYGYEDTDVSRGYGEKWDSTPITGITEGAQYAYNVKVQSFNANKGAYVLITYYDESGRSISSTKSSIVSGTNENWQNITGSTVAPPGAEYAVMSLCIDGTGVAWFADAGFELGSKEESPDIDGDDDPDNPGGGGGGTGGGSGSAGGGGGSSISGGSGSQSGTMGNFNTGSGTAEGDDVIDVTGDPEALIPQPDPSYFTQGMDVIGGFRDIRDVSWAQKAIVALTSIGVVNGKEEGLFYPNDNVTRAEFVKILVGALEYAGRIDTENVSCSFADVPETEWYYAPVAAAVNAGIVTGVSDTEFAPNANITRQDMALMLTRAADAAGIELRSGAETTFTDEASIAGYALDAVKTMSRAGIVNGFDDGSFMPMNNATRAQAAVVIYRTMGGTD